MKQTKGTILTYRNANLTTLPHETKNSITQHVRISILSLKNNYIAFGNDNAHI